MAGITGRAFTTAISRTSTCVWRRRRMRRESYHVNDEADERVDDIVDSISRHVRTRIDIRHVPLEEARTKMGPYAEALALDQIVRSPRARALGWSPTLHSVAGNVARLLEEFRTACAAAAKTPLLLTPVFSSVPRTKVHVRDRGSLPEPRTSNLEPRTSNSNLEQNPNHEPNLGTQSMDRELERKFQESSKSPVFVGHPRQKLKKRIKAAIECAAELRNRAIDRVQRQSGFAVFQPKTGLVGRRPACLRGRAGCRRPACSAP